MVLYFFSSKIGEKLPPEKKRSLKLVQAHVGQGVKSPFLSKICKWWLCQPVVSFWPTLWFKLMTSSVDRPQTETHNFKNPVLISVAYNIGHCLFNQSSTIHLPQKWLSWAQWDLFWMDSLVSLEFSSLSSSLMALSPSSSSFVIFLSYCWLLNMLRRHLWTAPYWWNEWPKISITLSY